MELRHGLERKNSRISSIFSARLFLDLYSELLNQHLWIVEEAKIRVLEAKIITQIILTSSPFRFSISLDTIGDGRLPLTMRKLTIKNII